MSTANLRTFVARSYKSIKPQQPAHQGRGSSLTAIQNRGGSAFCRSQQLAPSQSADIDCQSQNLREPESCQVSGTPTLNNQRPSTLLLAGLTETTLHHSKASLQGSHYSTSTPRLNQQEQLISRPKSSHLLPRPSSASNSIQTLLINTHRRSKGVQSLQQQPRRHYNSASTATMTVPNDLHPASSLADHRQTPIKLVASNLEKPLRDDRQYRVIQLPNKLEVLLVHDAETDKASAAMDVNVGNFSDPDDLPGLGHSLEHMLFMGTKKARFMSIVRLING